MTVYAVIITTYSGDYYDYGTNYLLEIFLSEEMANKYIKDLSLDNIAPNFIGKPADWIESYDCYVAERELR